MKRQFAIGLPAAVLGAAVWLGTPSSPSIDIDGRAFVRSDQRVNEFTMSAQANVSLDRGADGTLVAVWDSRRQQEGTYGVYTRWLNTAGEPKSPEEAVNITTSSMQTRPAVAVGDANRPYFTWTSEFQDGDAGSVIGRGVGNETLVNTRVDGDQRNAAVAALGSDLVAATWETSTESGPRVAVRILDVTSGTPVTDDIIISAPEGTIDRLPTLDATDEAFIVAWARATTEGLPLGVLAQRFDAAGARLGDVIDIAVRSPAVEPSIALGDDGIVAAWLELDEDTDYDVWVRRFDAEGRPLAPAAIATDGRDGRQSAASVDCLADGRFVVAWNDVDVYGEGDVCARWFDANGNALTAAVPVTETTEGSQLMTAMSGPKRVSLSDDGSLAVAWHGDGNLGDKSGAHVSVLTPRPHLLASAWTEARDKIASLIPTRSSDETQRLHVAEPYIPPTHDPSIGLQPVENDARVTGTGIGFTGFVNTGWNPPDPHMAAGPDNIVIIVNGGIAARGRDGSALWQFPIEGSSGFWGNQGAGGFVFDPEVIYDVLSDRFFAMANERTGGRSYFLLAVSSTSDATSVWYKYRFDVTALAGDDIDSPNLGVDADVVYLTADFFGPDKYLFFMVDKASILSGGLAVTTSVLHTGSQSMGAASMYTADAPQMYFIQANEGTTENAVRFWTVNDPLGAPSLTQQIVSVPTYHRPAQIPHMGGSGSTIAFEARFWSCMYRDGSLWAAHHTGVSAGGKTISRWYEFEMNGWPTSGNPPTLKQSGDLDFGGNIVTSFNSAFADADGNAAMVVARSAPNEFYSIWRTHRESTDALGTMGNRVEVQTSTGAPSGQRWGDYSAIVADPVVPRAFWLHHEYSVGSSWRTWVEQFSLDGPIAVPPTDVIAGGLDLAPSPTTGATRFRFELTEAAPTRVEVYSVAGRLVKQMSLGALSAATHEIAWDGRTESGDRVADGVYLAKVVSGNRLIGTDRLVVVR